MADRVRRGGTCRRLLENAIIIIIPAGCCASPERARRWPPTSSSSSSFVVVVVLVFVTVVGRGGLAALVAASFRGLPTDRRCTSLSCTTVNGRATFQPHHPAPFATITRVVRRFAHHHLAPPSLVVTPRSRRHPSSWNAVCVPLSLSLLWDTLSSYLLF